MKQLVSTELLCYLDNKLLKDKKTDKMIKIYENGVIKPLNLSWSQADLDMVDIKQKYSKDNVYLQGNIYSENQEEIILIKDQNYVCLLI